MARYNFTPAMNSSIALVKTLIVICMVLNPFGGYGQEPIVLKGRVTSLPMLVHPATEVVVRNASNSEEIARAWTNEQGGYEITIDPTGVHTLTNAGVRVYPNPFYQRASLAFTAGETGTHRVLIATLTGQAVALLEVNLLARQSNTLEINGLGNAGTYIATIQSPSHRQSVRMVQTHSHRGTIHLNGDANSSNPLVNVSPKSASTSGFTLEYWAEQHEPKDTTVSYQSHDLEIFVQQIQQTQTASFGLNATNHPMNQPVDGTLRVINEHDEELFTGSFSGSIAGTINRDFFAHQGDTLAEFGTLRFITSSNLHATDTLTVPYTVSISLNAVLNQVKQSQTRNLTLYATNSPMNKEIIADVKVYNGSNESELLNQGQTNNAGVLSLPITRGFYAYANDTLPDFTNVKVKFDAETHQSLQQTTTYGSNMNLNAVLQQLKQTQTKNLEMYVTNNPMNKEIISDVVVKDEQGNVLNQGVTNNNGSLNLPLTRGFYAYANDTLPDFTNVNITFNAEAHQSSQQNIPYNENMNLHEILQQIKQNQTKNLNVSVTNNPMNTVVKNADVKTYNDDELLNQGVTNDAGVLSLPINRGFYAYANDTLPDFTNIRVTYDKPAHVSKETLNVPYNNMNLDEVLEQIAYNDNGTLLVNLNSVPLNYAPNNVSLTIKNQEETLANDIMNNGTSTFNIPFVFYVNDQDTMRIINGNNAETLKVLTNHSEHADAEYNVPFKKQMTLNENIAQTPIVGSTNISLVAENDFFGYLIQGANVTLKNASNQNILATGVTDVNGAYNGVVNYNYWTHEALYLSELENILLNVTKPYHQNYSVTFDNEEQNLNITLVQTPEQKNATITGYIKENTAPLNNASFVVKTGENVLQTLTTNTEGKFQGTQAYQLFVNHSNPTEKVTIPSNVYGVAQKEGYVSHTTEPKSLEDIVNFGDINIEQPLQNFTFTIKPYTMDNAEMTSVLAEPFTLHIKNKTKNQEYTFTQTGNNPLQISIEGHGYDEIKMWNDHLELTDYTIIEHPGQDWREDNVAQNRPIRQWTHGEPRDTLTSTLSVLSNPDYKETMEMYIPRHNFATTYGNITFTGDTLMTMLAGRVGPNRIVNWKADHVPHIDRMIWAYDFGTGAPITQDKIDQMINIAQNVDQATVSASGRIRMPIQYHVVNSMEDDIVTQASARGWDYTNRSWREAGQVNNSISIDVENWRIQTGYATYPQIASPGQILEEEFEKTFGTGNAPNNTPSVAYIYAVDGEGIATPSLVGKTMGAVSATSNPWTEVLPAETYKTTPATNNANTKDTEIKYNYVEK
jgi:hypothetical protein